MGNTNKRTMKMDDVRDTLAKRAHDEWKKLGED